MSAIGTGIAASVAQVGLQSQQIARQHDKRQNNRTRQAKHAAEVFETRLVGLEEHDGDEQATRLHVDNQQPDREHPDDTKPDDHQPDDDQYLADDPTHQALPDADTLMRQLAATADPAIQRKATAAPSPGDSPGDSPGAGADALYTHIDIQA